jgi:hypothetical protein
MYFDFWHHFLLVWLQSLKIVLIKNMTLQKFFAKNKKRYKNEEFHADLISVEKL